jgi:hypothetical protein
MQESIEEQKPEYIVRIKVAEFQVWEQPVNHINLSSTILVRVYSPDKPDTPEYVYEARNAAAKQSIGTMMTTSGGFIKEMNKISNKFAATLSEEILEKLQGTIKSENPTEVHAR